MMVIMGRLKAAGGKRDELKKLCASLVGPSRAEPGCVSYSFLEDQMEEGTFIFFEEWRDRDAINHHFDQPYFRQAMAILPALLGARPMIKIYSVAGVKQV